MPNTNAQAIRIANEKIRVLADKFGQLYNFCNALKAEGVAEGWTSLFPVDSEVVSDGSAVDGRAQINNTDVSQLITMASDLITWMEASSNTRRNLALKVAVNPEHI